MRPANLIPWVWQMVGIPSNSGFQALLHLLLHPGGAADAHGGPNRFPGRKEWLQNRLAADMIIPSF